MSLLVAVGFLGLVRLAEAVGIGSRSTRLVAGAAFTLWPTFTILAGSSSGGVLPGLLAPWAVMPLVSTGRARTAAARSGLVVACMGGINAASTLAALVLPGMYILTRPGRRRPALAGWWVLAARHRRPGRALRAGRLRRAARRAAASAGAGGSGRGAVSPAQRVQGRAGAGRGAGAGDRACPGPRHVAAAGRPAGQRRGRGG